MTKRYEELTIADDFMFGKVMEDKGLCRKVLECLFGKAGGETGRCTDPEGVSLYLGGQADPPGCIPETGSVFMMLRCRI